MNIDSIDELIHLSAKSTAPTPECIEPESLWEAAAGNLSPAATRQLLQHAIGCGRCTKAWQLARSLQQDTRVSTADVNAMAWHKVSRWVMAAAATLASVAVVSLYVLPGGPTNTQWRGAAQQIVSPLTSGALPREAFVLRWSNAGEGALYTLRVSTEEFQIIEVVQGLEETEFRVPPNKLLNVPIGTRMLWQVDVFFPTGHQVSSEAFDVSLLD